MRLLIVACLLLAGCTAPPAPTEPLPETQAPPRVEERYLLQQEYLARSGEEGQASIKVPAGTQQVWLRVQFDTGASTGVEFRGLGACDGFRPGATLGVAVQSGSSVEKDCGQVPAGEQSLSWTSDGVSTGKISVRARVAV